MSCKAGKRASSLPFPPFHQEEWRCMFLTFHIEQAYSYENEKKLLIQNHGKFWIMHSWKVWPGSAETFNHPQTQPHKPCFLQWRWFTRLTVLLLSILTQSLSITHFSSTTVFNKTIHLTLALQEWPLGLWFYVSKPYTNHFQLWRKSKRREDLLHCRDYANFHALFALPKLQAMEKEVNNWSAIPS